MKRLMRINVGVIVMALAMGTSACGGSDDKAGEKGGSEAKRKPKIALSNSYNGNFFRQTMVKSFEAAADGAKTDGLIAGSTVVNADNTANGQLSQLQSLLVQDWDVITINAASPTALNGAIQQACAKGTKVVAFSSLVTADCAYKVSYDWESHGRQQAEYIGKQLGGKGNVLEIRGISGTSVDDDIHRGTVEGFKQFPDIKIVGSVRGNWTKSVSQQAVAGILPSLPQVDAVVTQGGDGTGAALAFKAANRPIPTIIMGNRGDELRLWKELVDGGSYETISLSAAPGVASIALWVGYLLAIGEDVPKDIRVPLIPITTAEQRDAWIGVTPPDGVAGPIYTLDFTKRLVAAVKGGAAPPNSPKPGDSDFKSPF
ncbi:ABC transporter substrate-binding protein [Dactylosporangium sp. NPDC051484]|uniref:ABC transporter substrate-binding protein n=1 Tax=Dactylosporangium sp. NPDC051484 TaxID=3154942 RepID=UPI00344C1ED4